MSNFFSTVSQQEAGLISPVTLAFVGDAVYSLYVRQRLAIGCDYHAGTLQKLSSDEVSAKGQNRLLQRLLPRFSEDELAIYKRGRNAKKPMKSKSATVEEYNNSTGFEAVLGYLYLSGNYERLSELLETNGEI